jgi:hypothetical protein
MLGLTSTQHAKGGVPAWSVFGKYRFLELGADRHHRHIHNLSQAQLHRNAADSIRKTSPGLSAFNEHWSREGMNLVPIDPKEIGQREFSHGLLRSHDR